ncbi:relaxase/mobilization nuclease domain-containing protein [Ensifer sp. YR511]|uniref:relaxase/mobilization nuclease domain-containing protein n=1 Tax=Ensifer sp. YR511 TaxID=1855294 RepID=UPI000888C6D8|nr:relaxase/mobilization nuclease domain-containing protein [Ensifer sp. YR511]SDO05674.1 Relaxase/Mobilisation nuclease domain-containing protein [Ensifer sp. YR511]
METTEALIKRIPKGGTRSVKGLAKQLGYLSRQTDRDRETINLVPAQRHQFDPGNPNVVDPNDVWAFARRVYERSGRLLPNDPNGELDNDLTMHFVISFPRGTDLPAAERAGRDWAEYVFGHGHRNSQRIMQRHDYVTAFHSHGDDRNHPHMHVVVDRVPLGGGHLLTLELGHPHWSYEAMRLQAVEAAANHGIELVATTRADRGLTERPMTDVQFREFQRLLMQRPTTRDDALRRREDARMVPYFDPMFDGEGRAPGANEISEDVTRENVDQSCEPIYVAVPDRNALGRGGPGGGGPGGVGPGGGGPSGGGGRGDGRQPPDNRGDLGNGPPGEPRNQTERLDGVGDHDEDGNVFGADGADFGGGDDMSDSSQSRSGRNASDAGPSGNDERPTGEDQSGGDDAQRPAVTAESSRHPDQSRANIEAAAQAQAAHRLAARNRREQEARDDQDRRRKIAERPADEAQRLRSAQRSADRSAREQETFDDDGRRRRTPTRSAEERLGGRDVSAGPSGSNNPPGNEGRGSASQDRSRLSPVDEARQRLRNARAAERAHRMNGPHNSGATRQAWREEHHRLRGEVRRANIDWQRARHGGPNVTTRAQARAQAANADAQPPAQQQQARPQDGRTLRTPTQRSRHDDGNEPRSR